MPKVDGTKVKTVCQDDHFCQLISDEKVASKLLKRARKEEFFLPSPSSIEPFRSLPKKTPSVFVDLHLFEHFEHYIPRTPTSFSTMADLNDAVGEASKEMEFTTSDETIVNTKRQRKASTLYDNEFDPTKSSIRQSHFQQKCKPAGSKKRSVEESGGKSADSNGAASSSSSGGTKEPKKNKQNGNVSASQTIVVIPAREREQQSIEEDFMRNNKEKMGHKRVPMPIGASDPLEFPAAIKKSVKDCSSLLLDWNQNAAKLIGATCKVFWDGDDEWFYARILNYDQRYDRHFVYYFADDTSEWLSIRNEAVFVAEAFVLAKMRGAWPAIRYWASPKAREVSKSIKGYHKNCEYIEFFSESEAASNTCVKEYAFLAASQLEPLCEEFFPSNPHKTFNARLEAARKEQIEMSSVQASVVQTIRKALFDTTNVAGSAWLGVRARASTHRVFTPDEQELTADYSSKDDAGSTVDMGAASAASSSTEISSKISMRRHGAVGAQLALRPPPVEHVMVRCIGSIVRYCASAGQHLVVFDDALLQPQWVRSRPDEIDVLLGPEASEYYGSDPLRTISSSGPLSSSSSSSSSTAGSSSSSSSTAVALQEPIVVCMMCNGEGCVTTISDDHSGEANDASSSSAASVSQLSSMKMCVGCSKYCHHHCLPKNIAGSESSLVVAETDSFVMRGVGYTWQSFGECEKEEREAKMKGGKYQSKPKSKGSSSSSSSSNSDAPIADTEWMCFDCIKCEGCGATASEKALLHWNVKRVSDEKSFADRPIIVCADCMVRFKEKKDYCPVCYQFYEMEDNGDDVAVTSVAIADDKDAAAADTAAVLAAADGLAERDVFQGYGAFSNDRVRVPSSSDFDGETAAAGGGVGKATSKRRGKKGKAVSRPKAVRVDEVSTVGHPCATGELIAFLPVVHDIYNTIRKFLMP